MNLAIPDMSTWSILNFELAFDGARRVNDATLWLQNQPRAYDAGARRHHPGADFICALGEEWCAAVVDQVIKTLEQKRFNDPEDEDRRLRLLLTYYAGWGPAGEPLSEVLAMLDRWQAPRAA